MPEKEQEVQQVPVFLTQADINKLIWNTHSLCNENNVMLRQLLEDKIKKK